MAAPPPFAQQITFLYATDTAASRRFYGETLGLPLLLDQGSCAIYAVAGDGGCLGVCAARGVREVSDPRREGGAIITLVTPAVEAWHARLLAAGVPVEAPPAQHAGLGITHFFFRDPAGYLLEIQRFPEGIWPPAEAPAATSAAPGR